MKPLKKWNRIAKVKAIIIGILFLPNLIKPTNNINLPGYDLLIVAFLFPIIVITIMNKKD